MHDLFFPKDNRTSVPIIIEGATMSINNAVKKKSIETIGHMANLIFNELVSYTITFNSIICLLYIYPVWSLGYNIFYP